VNLSSLKIGALMNQDLGFCSYCKVLLTLEFTAYISLTFVVF
jgi:hypothetical protein